MIMLEVVNVPGATAGLAALTLRSNVLRFRRPAVMVTVPFTVGVEANVIVALPLLMVKSFSILVAVGISNPVVIELVDAVPP